MSTWAPTDRRLSVSTVEPIDLETTKQALRFSTDCEDELIEGYIATARAIFEEQTGRQLINTSWQYAVDTVPICGVIQLPKPPLYGDVVITYDDADGVEQTLDAAGYTVHGSFLEVGSPASRVIEPYCEAGRIELASDVSWPTIDGTQGSLRITRTCGYGTRPSAIPGVIKSALYLLVGHFHRNRSEVQVNLGQGFDTLPMGAQAIINTFKWRTLPLADGITSCRTLP